MYTMTNSGRLISKQNIEAPSLLDIALGLSRMPRFAGQGSRWYSVLDHSLFVEQLASREHAKRPAERLALLLHDAHEAVTGDIPTHLKTEDMRAVQYLLDAGVVAAHFGGRTQLWESMRPLVHEWDQRALVAEAVVIGPPALGTLAPGKFLELFPCLPREEDISMLRAGLSMNALSNPQMLIHGERAPNVRSFVRMAELYQRAAQTELHPIATVGV